MRNKNWSFYVLSKDFKCAHGGFRESPGTGIFPTALIILEAFTFQSVFP